jgi:hypothetical protein
MKTLKTYEGFFDIFNKFNDEKELSIGIINFINKIKPELNLTYSKRKSIYFIHQNKDIFINIEKDRFNNKGWINYINITLYKILDINIKKFLMNESINEDFIYDNNFNKTHFGTTTFRINKNNIQKYILSLTIENYEKFIKYEKMKKFNL